MPLPSNQPENINFLSQFGFKFTLARAKHINYFCQSVELPGINLSVAEAPTPFTVIPLSGKVSYPELGMTFRVDENMENWQEIVDWMVALGSPVDFSGYRELKENPPMSTNSLTSDITLSILKSSRNLNKEFVFRDAFPVQISGVRLSTMDTDVQYVECTAIFRYLRYEMV